MIIASVVLWVLQTKVFGGISVIWRWALRLRLCVYHRFPRVMAQQRKGSVIGGMAAHAPGMVVAITSDAA